MQETKGKDQRNEMKIYQKYCFVQSLILLVHINKKIITFFIEYVSVFFRLHERKNNIKIIQRSQKLRQAIQRHYENE